LRRDQATQVAGRFDIVAISLDQAPGGQQGEQCRPVGCEHDATKDRAEQAAVKPIASTVPMTIAAPLPASAWYSGRSSR